MPAKVKNKWRGLLRKWAKPLEKREELERVSKWRQLRMEGAPRSDWEPLRKQEMALKRGKG